MSFRVRPASYGKRILRLDPQVYAELGAICAITIAVEGRRPVFSDALVASTAEQVLREYALKTGVAVYG